jgi:hypothetical protein
MSRGAGAHVQARCTARDMIRLHRGNWTYPNHVQASHGHKGTCPGLARKTGHVPSSPWASDISEPVPGLARTRRDMSSPDRGHWTYPNRLQAWHGHKGTCPVLSAGDGHMSVMSRRGAVPRTCPVERAHMSGLDAHLWTRPRLARTTGHVPWCVSTCPLLTRISGHVRWGMVTCPGLARTSGHVRWSGACGYSPVRSSKSTSSPPSSRRLSSSFRCRYSSHPPAAASRTPRIRKMSPPSRAVV